MAETAIKWLTPKQLADRLNVSVGRLANWRMVGRGPTVTKMTPHAKGRVLYAIEDVLQWESTLQRQTMNVDQNASEAFASL
jgi:predicted nucleic acid-binding Zn ribbon protein